MKILSLHMEGFGKFHQQDVFFKDGLNVVYGKNEAGKSTLHTFIRGMLFGIERQRGRASRNDTYSRYEPWEGSGTYEGWLRLESEGEIFRIERRFQKNNKSLTIINETLGREEVPDKALWDRLRCGLSETAYDNTISIGQLKCATDGGMVAELRNYIANLNTSGSIALNITKASAYLKAQKKEWERQLVPEAARSYASVLGEIKKLETEISAPQYANQLIACREKKETIRRQLEERQSEKEGLLEKAAKGRQILLNSQFTDQSSVQRYLEDTERLFKEHRESKAAADRRGRTVMAAVLFLLALGGVAGSVISFLAPGLLSQVIPDFPEAAGTAFSVLLGAGAILCLILGGMQLSRSSHFKKELETSSRLLQEIFARHLGDGTISPESMEALKGKLAEFLRLSKAVEQSEAALKRLSDEIAALQAQEEGISGQIEQQQRLQWELEQKLEQLDQLKTKAGELKRIQAENERIQTELDALDLAQDTMTSLSTSIRDSFGLYLNKTASQLIEGITGGIYTSMSIDQNLDIFMNTPGRLVPISQVSSGTMDQIYLALRLAAARLVQDGKDAMPLVFDDSFVLYDDERLKTALKWLVKAYTGQIIIFTCHQREAQLLTANQVGYHFVEI